jgi:hypothetical protein
MAWSAVGTGPGDSGSSSFNGDGASPPSQWFRKICGAVTGFSGFYAGYTRVAIVIGRAAVCSSRYDFVASQMPAVSATPEPASVTLLATGLFGIVADGAAVEMPDATLHGHCRAGADRAARRLPSSPFRRGTLLEDDDIGSGQLLQAAP